MIVSQLNQKFHNLTQYLHWYKRLHPGKKTAYLVASPTHENTGDAAIVLGVHSFLREHGYSYVVEITTEEYWNYRRCIGRVMPRDALICLNGGGNMGDVYQLEETNRRTILGDFPNHRVVIFPQTIYYTDEQAQQDSVPYYNRENITITAREKTSYEMMKALYPRANVILAPDIVLSMNDHRHPHPRKGIVICFREDREQLMTNEARDTLVKKLQQSGYNVTNTDMMYGASIPREKREQVVEDKKNIFARAELVITDRLHAMILCVISGTPCLVFGNNHHKIRGVYEWIKYLDYISFVQSTEEVLEKLEAFISRESRRYIPRMEDFKQLADAVRPR